MEGNGISWIAGAALLAMFLYGVSEMLWLSVFRKKGERPQVSFRHEYSQLLKNLPLVIGSSIVVPVLTTASFAYLGQAIAPFSLGNDWYIWIVALLVYEFWYWVQHFLVHKVRFLWCLHSPHHAPDTMNMMVGYNHQMLEGPYMAFFSGFMPALFGVPLEMIIAINLFDVVWGSMLHASPRVINRRYGPLEYFMQTPSYHRVHHAQNVRYMDTNYNSITLFWDKLLGTLQPLKEEESVNYGITRDVDVESWRDVQLGEFGLLWRDVMAAPSIANKLCYLAMPPGWSHLGNHKTASAQKRALGA